MKPDIRTDSSATAPEAEPRTAVTTPVVYTEDALRPSDLVRFLRRHRRLIVAAGLAAGVLSAIVAVALTPREYEASATLVLMPPSFSSELKPQLMSIQGFQRLLESDALIDETVGRLVDEGVLREDETRIEIGSGLRTRIYVSRRSEATTLAPVIELTARGTSAENTAAIVNTWADVFLERSQELQSRTTRANIDLVETQYAESSERVMELEKEYLESEESFEKQIAELKLRWRRQIDEAQARWDRKIVEFDNETEDQIVLFQLETRREIEGFARSQGLVASSRPQADGLTPGPGRPTFHPEVEKRLLQIMTLRIQLAQTLQVLSLQKAISNDALWQATLLTATEIVDLQDAIESNLSSQEINLVYMKLAEELSKREVGLEEIAAGDRESIRQVTSGMEGVQRQRTAGLLKLYAQRLQESQELRMQKSRELAELSLQRQTELQNLERRHDSYLKQQDRRLLNARDLLTELARRYNQAEIARGAQDLADVRLAAPAVPPHEPRSRRLVSKALIGVFLGGVIGSLMAVVREINGNGS